MDESQDQNDDDSFNPGDQTASPAQTGEGSSRRPFKRRSHAKRTCDRCKKLKTKCVLPDTNIYSSTKPLPASLSCARCAQRGIDCIVNDSRGPKAPPPGYAVFGSLALRPGQVVPGMAGSSTQMSAQDFGSLTHSNMFPGGDDVIWHTMSGERLGDGERQAAEQEASRPVMLRHVEPPPGIAKRVSMFAPAAQVFAIVRPLALLSHLVNGLIQKSGVEIITEIGRSRCEKVAALKLSPAVQKHIEQKYTSLLAWAPHLPTLEHVQEVSLSPILTNAENRFLLSAIYWITLADCTLPELHHDVRRDLKADIVSCVLRALSSLPPKLDIAQALVLLATHSALDFELDQNPTSDHIPFRGLIAAARTIALALDLPNALDSIRDEPPHSIRQPDRLERLSCAALWMTICVLESHITMSRESLMNASIDRLCDVENDTLSAYEREAVTLLGANAFNHLALVHRVRVFKNVDFRVRCMYTMVLPTTDYSGDVTRRFRDLFADFDEMRHQQTILFSHYRGELPDKLSDWLQIELSGIEECLCQRFGLYVWLGTFLPPPEVDTRSILMGFKRDPSRSELVSEMYARNTESVTRYLSIFAKMGSYISVLPQVLTLAMVTRAAKVILEQNTARMIGWRKVSPNVETLELLVTWAARALGEGFKYDIGTKTGTSSTTSQADHHDGTTSTTSTSNGIGQRTYSFGLRYPCGSAESIPLLCTYLMHEIAIALNRRAKLCQLLDAQARRTESEGQDATAAQRRPGTSDEPAAALESGPNSATSSLQVPDPTHLTQQAHPGQHTVDGSEPPGASSTLAQSGQELSHLLQQEDLPVSIPPAFAGAPSTYATLLEVCQPLGMTSFGSSGQGGIVQGPFPSLMGESTSGAAEAGPFGPEGQSRLLLDSLVPASWIDTVFQAGGLNFDAFNF
ncbi:hypothetical protein OC846_003544 [Tilletia horrida]|uniref:Zn(2)-C6 fungal-type domain-containing protein n=1 Tax=Tilletia horrida TaxID=155126 RepID=A0AAN6GPB2_9BASI|nr:hypothetical protein OC846_003544 [Tilletia horrida]